MAVEPYDWNVVVAGYWNPAILTPSGIARRLFKLQEGTPILVEVPIDGIAPHRVRHEGIIVTAELERLSIMTDTPTLSNLERARNIGACAVKALPETPLTAAGFNIRLRIKDELPERFISETNAHIDISLSDAQFAIKTRSMQRGLECGKGVLNVVLRQGANAELEINFHRDSPRAGELCEWLEMPTNQIRDTISRILDQVLGMPFQEDWL